jgi:hypothetical protein
MAEERLVDFGASTIAARSPGMIEQLRTAAQSMIATRQALRQAMPGEFIHCPALDLLFALFVADHQTLPIADLTDSGQTAPQVVTRWITLFIQRDLVKLRGNNAMLTEAGFRMMASACQAVIVSQPGACPPRLN